jgi:ATP-binding cassette subfamily B protein/subfamily B ATP-binding cassette protein MsbA
MHETPAASASPDVPNSISTSDRPAAGSRPRFEAYRAKVAKRQLPPTGGHSADDGRVPRARARSTKELVWEFVRLLGPYRWQMTWVLATATLATLIGLLPPAGTKFVIDYGLSGKQLPPLWLERFPTLSDPKRLLLTTVVVVSIVSLAKVAIHVWGRWYATKITKQIQLNVRRRVFEHAVRLPLHRVQEQELKSKCKPIEQGIKPISNTQFPSRWCAAALAAAELVLSGRLQILTGPFLRRGFCC